MFDSWVCVLQGVSGRRVLGAARSSNPRDTFQYAGQIGGVGPLSLYKRLLNAPMQPTTQQFQNISSHQEYTHVCTLFHFRIAHHWVYSRLVHRSWTCAQILGFFADSMFRMSVFVLSSTVMSPKKCVFGNHSASAQVCKHDFVAHRNLTILFLNFSPDSAHKFD